jgi:predicted RNA-binding protein with PIN domain
MAAATRARSFWRGVGETLGIVAAFVASGSVARTLAEHRIPHGVPYPSTQMAEMARPQLWLVDGFNALHVALLRGREREAWWTEARRAELLERVRSFDEPGAEVWVVFDGSRPLPDPERGEGASGPRVAFAPSADAWLLRRVREAAGAEVVVVTADRRLGDRVRARGARVVSPQAFLARCTGAGATRTDSQASGAES